MASGRFAMAVHALAVLAQSDEGYPSEFIAGSVNTHAVFLRRVLSALLKAGIVDAREGRNGGYRLARRPEQITLAEVYEAMEPEGPLSPSPAEPNARCPVGAGMRAAFEETANLARNGVASALEGQTIADVARRALRFGKRK
jgi:Rrf2 family transcriptional regulator, repressor of oqxAB